MDCLKRAIKIADICMSSAKNLYLFIVLLNKYLYYYSVDADFVTAEDINHLIDLIREHVDQCEGSEDQIKEALTFFQNTKAAIKLKQEGNGRYKAINV
mmetsp:Transcript_43474/g.41925  ORF Transcript_43474/g.41925 Transcript_43474/m.41925 type:complete len:98 (+) Transcript_43474:2090-2383(+)